MIDENDPDLVGWQPSSDKSKPPYPIYCNSSGIWFCPCDGFKWRGKCSHIKKFKEGQEVVVKVRITFTSKTNGPLTIPGYEVPLDVFKVHDLTTRIAETEEHLSRLTGMAVRIDTDLE